MKNILVTGSNGQLGNEIRDLSNIYNNFNFLFTDIDDLDITNTDKLHDYVKTKSINYIINCAAYTAVDKAEVETEKAFAINAEAVKNITRICKLNNIFLVHISTDYVFDGSKNTPYNEKDKVCPISQYGKSKLLAEDYILEQQITALIIRTSWLYSSYGHNFVKTIMKLANERQSLNVVYDQIGSLTYATDLAKMILDVISLNKLKNNCTDIINYSNEGVTAWYDIAYTIVKEIKSKCIINPIETHEYPVKGATRPHYSVLSKAKVKTEYGINVPYWRDSLLDCIKKLTKEGF